MTSGISRDSSCAIARYRSSAKWVSNQTLNVVTISSSRSTEPASSTRFQLFVAGSYVATCTVRRRKNTALRTGDAVFVARHIAPVIDERECPLHFRRRDAASLVCVRMVEEEDHEESRGYHRAEKADR